MTADIWIPAATTFVVGTALLAVLRSLLLRFRHLDFPNARSSHIVAVPRGGGVALIIAAIAGAITAWSMGVSGSGASPGLNVILAFAICVGLLGTADDWRPLPAWIRLVIQSGIALGYALWFLVSLQQPLAWTPLLALSLIGYVNVANFMDGINGISGLYGLVAGAVYLMIGLHRHQSTIQLGALILIAVCIAFLPWNAPHARLFLGDSGSYFIGGLVVTLCVTSLATGVAFEIAVAPTLVYAADSAWTIIIRIRRHERVMQPHRSHVYQRLTGPGRNHMPVASAIAGLSALTWVILLLGVYGGGAWRLIADGATIMLLAGYLSLPMSMPIIRLLFRRPLPTMHPRM